MGNTHVCDALHLYHNIHMDPIVWFWIITLESVVTPFIKISTITETMANEFCNNAP